MANKTLKRSHIVAGAIGVLIGSLAVFEAWNYPMGSLTRMGPGYFPILLGFVMIFLSILVIVFEGRLETEPDLLRPAWHGLIWIPLAIAAFAVLVERFGMAPAVVAAVVLSAFADDDLSWKETAVLAIATAAVCCVIFIFILGLPLKPIKGW